GDELGMSNVKFDRIEDYDDIEVKTNYAQAKERGADLKRFLEAMKITSRDNGRTPFQWDATREAGCTTGKPWLKVNPNYTTVNVAAEEKDPRSPLQYFRRLVKLRKATPALVHGAYTLLDADNPDVYAYLREQDGTRLVVMLNFTAHPATAATGVDLTSARALIGNYETPSRDGRLRPYEAVILQL